MEQLTQDPPKLRKIYDYLKKGNLVRAATYEDWEQKMQDPRVAEKTYNYLRDNGKVSANSFDEFQTKVGLKKKESTQPAQVVPQDGSQVSAPLLESGLTEEQERQRNLAELSQQPVASEISPEQAQGMENFGKLDINQIIADQQKSPEQLRDEARLNQVLSPEVGARNVVREIAGANQKPGDIQQIADNPGSAFQQGVGAFNQAVISTFTSIPKSVGILANKLNKLTQLEEDKPVEEMATYKLGKWLDKAALDLGIGATDPEKADSFWQSTVPSAFGSVVGIILTGGRGLGAKAPALTAEASALGQVGRTLASPGAVTGGTAMAVPEFEQAKASGLSDDEAFNVYLKNYLVGQTEILPIQRALGRLNKFSGGKLIEIVKAGAPGAVEEGTQELVQTYLTNKIAQGSYDPKRDLFQDVIKSGAAGAFVGMFLPGIHAAMQQMTPKQKAETQKVLNDEFKKAKSEQPSPEVDTEVQSGTKPEVQPKVTPKQDAVQERSTETLSVDEASGDSQKVEQGVSEQKEAPIPQSGITEEAKVAPKEEYEVKPVIGSVQGKNIDYTPGKNLNAEQTLIESETFTDLDENYDQRKKEYESKFGNVLDADNARSLIKSGNEQASAVQRPVSAFILKMYKDKLQEPAPEGKRNVVVFTSGGPGAGKTTITSKSQNDAHIVYDQNMAGLQVSKNQINRALNAGKDVEINYVYRDPVESFEEGVLPRTKETGRILPISEHIRIHLESQDTAKKLLNEYKGNDRVKINIIDNSGVQNKKVDSIDNIDTKKHTPEELTNTLTSAVDKAYLDGKITADQYRKFKGDDNAELPSAEPPATPKPTKPKTDAPKTGAKKPSDVPAAGKTTTESDVERKEQKPTNLLSKLVGKKINFEGKSGIVKSIEKRGDNYVAVFEDGDSKIISNEKEAEDHYLLYQARIKKDNPSTIEQETTEWDERRIANVFGDVGASLLKRYTDSKEVEVNYDRLFDQARKIQKADKRESESIPPEIIAEALQYEVSHNDNFSDLRSAVEKGGFENSQNAIERMLDVGVPVPEDILNEALNESQRNTLLQVKHFMSASKRTPKKAEALLAGMDKKNLQFLTKKGFLYDDVKIPYLTEKGNLVSEVLSPTISKTAKYAQPEPLHPFDKSKYKTTSTGGEVGVTKPESDEKGRKGQGRQERLLTQQEQTAEAPPASAALETKPSPSESISVGSDIFFDWQGVTKKGKITEILDDGRVKIKGTDGTTYRKSIKEVSQREKDIKKAAPKAPENIVEYNSKRKKPIGIIGDPKSGFMFQTDLGKTISKFFQKYFTAKGFLPRNVFDRWISAKGEMSKYESQIKFTVADMKNAIQEEYGKKLTDAEVTDINLALQGKEPQKPLPPKTAAMVQEMRDQIDNLSMRFIDEGIVAGDMADTFTKNLGTYVTRSYRKYDDPFWADFVPEEVKNKAMAFIRNNSQYKAQEYFSKAAKLRDRATRKPETVKALSDRIDALKKPFEKTISDKTTPKQVRDAIQKDLDNVIALKNRIANLEARDYDKIAQGHEERGKKLMEEGQDMAAQEAFTNRTRALELGKTKDQRLKRMKARLKELEKPFEAKISQYMTPERAREIVNKSALKIQELERQLLRVAKRDDVAAAERLEAKGRELMEMSNEDVDGLINFLLYSSEAPMAVLKGGKLGSKDLSILKRRGDIAPEIRALLGEYGDPLLNYARSVSKMAGYIAKHHFLEDVKAQGLNKFLFEKPTGNFYVPIAAEGSKTMAPLNGLYTTPEIAEAFNEFNSQDPVADWLRFYMKINAYVKSGKTVFSLMTHARNFFGNIGFVIANGHWRLNEAGRAAQTAWANVYSNDKAIREKLQEYIQLGIVQDSAAGGQLKAYLDDIRGGGDFFQRINESRLKKVKNGILDVTQNLYQFEDDLYKIYAFENEKARYRKAFPDMSEEELNQKAADIVRNTYPTYSMVPRIVKSLRLNPFIGTFVSFPAEVIRTTWNTAALAKEEMSNPSTRDIGAIRMAGLMTALLLPTIASYYSRFALGMDGDDDEDLKKFVAPWQKTSEFLYLNREGTKYKIIDMGFSDPHSYLKRPIQALLNGDDMTKSGITAAGEVLEPFLSEEMLTARLIDVKRNEKETGDHVYNPDAPVGDRLRDIYSHLAGAGEPGTVRSIENIYKAYEGKTDKYGKQYDLQNEITALLTGQKQEIKDIDQALLFRAYEIKNRLDITESDYYRVMKSKAATDEEKADAERRYNAAKKTIMSDALELYRAAIRLGVDPKDAKKTLYKTQDKELKKAIRAEIKKPSN